MPRFAEVLDKAESIALDEQAYEICPLIALEGNALRRAWDKASPLEIARYKDIVQRAYLELWGKEVKHEHIARGGC